MSVNNQAEDESNIIHPNDLLRALRAFTAQFYKARCVCKTVEYTIRQGQITLVFCILILFTYSLYVRVKIALYLRIESFFKHLNTAVILNE